MHRISRFGRVSRVIRVIRVSKVSRISRANKHHPHFPSVSRHDGAVAKTLDLYVRPIIQISEVLFDTSIATN